MMLVFNLTDEWLDFWTGRAEGYKPWFTRISAGGKAICTIGVAHDDGAVTSKFYRPSTDWTQGGPLIERYQLFVYYEKGTWRCEHNAIDDPDAGDTPLQAICRAVVRAEFGDEVPDINE